MSPIGEEEKHCRRRDDSRNSNLNADLSNAYTQKIDSQFDSQFSPGDGADDLQNFTSTMRMDNTFVLEDGFETQFANLAGETQVLDLGDEQFANLAGETQVIDFGGETQVLDDLDCMEKFPAYNDCSTEIASDSDSEETNETVVLPDTQEVSHDDSVNIDDINIDGCVVDSYSRKQATGALSSGEHHSGSICRTFTSIRAASVRASGLAARVRGVNGNSRSNTSVMSSLENQKSEKASLSLEDVSKSCMEHNDKFLWQDEGEGLRNIIPSKSGITVARKLFMEDEVGVVGQSEDDMKQADDNLDIFGAENCLGRLSYADSQEPGELSQANALEVVDRFLELNVEHEKGFNLRVPKEKEKVVPAAKGLRDLAKHSNIQSTRGVVSEAYDWDDTREDGEGGNLCVKMKELFFNKGGSKRRFLTEPRKRRCTDRGIIKPVEDHGPDEQMVNNKKVGDPVHSDPGLMFHKLKAKRKPLHTHKNLAQDFEQVDLASDHKSPDNDTCKDIPVVNDIGPDTQIAAEAMETLCFELHLPDNTKNVPNKGVCKTKKAPTRNQSSNKAALLEETLMAKDHVSVGVVTRRAKQTKRTITNTINELSRSSIRQSKDSKIKHGTELKETKETKSSETNSNVQDQLNFVVPVAQRTRKCMELNRPKDSEISLDNMTKKNNDKIDTHVLGEKKKTAKGKKVQIITLEKLRSLRSTGMKQSNVNNVGISKVLNVDKLNHPRGKRDRQEKFVGQEDESRCSMRLKRARTTIPSNEKSSFHFVNEATISKQLAENSLAKATKTNEKLEASPSERSKTLPPTCTTPVNHKSPICMGDEYHKQSCRKNLSRTSLMKELNSLVSGSPVSLGAAKEARKRREITSVRVLFSQHLDVDVTRHQKKILTRLGAAVASSMSDATHFVADEFARTRNMLEAIAFSKPVVTHLWLESCGQASCLIDEKNYILRDVKKEKEFGFSMPVSLSRASEHPLLEGQKVLVTPNTKPGKEILANLIKAVHGLAVERLGRSVLKDSKFLDDILILSCEEDYDLCVPYLEKGAVIYSSELLLNGIVKQKLEYERHRLFADHVKSTRSTIWVKKKNQYLPVKLKKGST